MTGCWSTTTKVALVVDAVEGDDVVCTDGPVSDNKVVARNGQ